MEERPPGPSPGRCTGGCSGEGPSRDSVPRTPLKSQVQGQAWSELAMVPTQGPVMYALVLFPLARPVSGPWTLGQATCGVFA